MKNEVYSEIRNLLKIYFNNDYEKIKVWLEFKNPLLGNLSPKQMIYMGREDKLLDFIKSSLDGNYP